MKKNDLILYNEQIHRILDYKDNQALIINCVKRTMPFFVYTDSIASCSICSENNLLSTCNLSMQEYDSLSSVEKKTAHIRYTLIAPVLPFISNEHMRSILINQISKDNSISKQTIRKYLCNYLSFQNISILVSSNKNNSKPLSNDEKNFRWALNKYFYSRFHNSLKTAYMLMLKEKYTDSNGSLLTDYPKFHRFKYFYQKTKKLQNYYISRDGISNYHRNTRPLLGCSVYEYANSIGVGMIDSTICDVYLVNEEKNLVGRPVLTACVDAYSGLCCGYSLSWEGGVYSLKLLMKNIIADKVEWCKKFNITINDDEWNCNKLPATLITDKGKEYTSYVFEQLTELGINIVNLPPYRPELKGSIEKFFDIVQNLYKPYLKGKGFVESDFKERGVPDYRKHACLTLNDFEKILLKCIIYYNTKRIIESFPYTEEMMNDNIKPYSNCIWNYSINKYGANLINVNSTDLDMTLLPRTKGKFTRKGLIVNSLRYKANGFTEQFLKGGDCVVSYNPNFTSCVWLYQNGQYIKFQLIDSLYNDLSFENATSLKNKHTDCIKQFEHDSLQAKIDLIEDIQTITNNCISQSKTNISSIKSTRMKEKRRTHIGD